MAIVTESLTIMGRAFIKTYSDASRYVVRDDVSCIDATDPAEFDRHYTEGDVIDEKSNPDEATPEDYEAALSRLGVNV